MYDLKHKREREREREKGKTRDENIVIIFATIISIILLNKMKNVLKLLRALASHSIIS
jgi:hypothetical protein